MNALEQHKTPTWNECVQLLGHFPTLSLDKRASAVEQLLRNPSPEIRTQAVRIGAGILPDEQLVEYLRSETDDVRRNAGLEILKLRGSRAFSLAVTLLQNQDPDVVLQAVLLLDHLKDPRAFESLRPLLRHADPNVVQSTIVAIGHLGDARAVQDLLPFLKQDFWVQMAAAQALGDLRDPSAAKVLESLLDDPFLAQLAFEGLARIGGREAFHALAANWVRGHHRIEAETKLGLMAHILEGRPFKPGTIPGFKECVAPFLEDTSDKIRKPAAACLLAIGPGADDARALEVLSSFSTTPHALPGCLRFRLDLNSDLLQGATAVLLSWGIQLATKFPHSTNKELFANALLKFELPDPPDGIANELSEMRNPAFGAALTDLYTRTPETLRDSLIPTLKANRETVRKTIRDHASLDRETRVILSAKLGEPAEAIVEEILNLFPDQQLKVLAGISGCHEVIRLLPWAEWFKGKPEFYAPTAVEVAATGLYPEMLPILRGLLEGPVTINLIRVFGMYRDDESISALASLLNNDSLGLDTDAIKAMVLETIGEIGGASARTALAGSLCSPDPRICRIALQSLSLCAIEEDLPLFKQALSSEDWFIRLAGVEALGRLASPENLILLIQMAADPVALIAQRAIALIEKGVGS